MSYCMYDSFGYIGDIASNSGLKELFTTIRNSNVTSLSSLIENGYVYASDSIIADIEKLPSESDTIQNFILQAKKCKDVIIINNGLSDDTEE